MKDLRSRLKLLTALTALGGVAAVARWAIRERRNPEPFPAARAAMLQNPVFVRHGRKTVEALDLVPGMKVLDVGAGVGRLSLLMAEKVGHDGEVVAVDIQQEMLDILEKRAADEGITNIRSLRAAGGDANLEQGVFDRAVLCGVLGEIPDLRRVPALVEIRDALKPGGILYVIELLSDPHFQTRAAVARLAQESGLRFVASRRLGLGHFTELRKRT